MRFFIASLLFVSCASAVFLNEQHARPARRAEAGFESMGATENKGVGAGATIGLRVRRFSATENKGFEEQKQGAESSRQVRAVDYRQGAVETKEAIEASRNPRAAEVAKSHGAAENLRHSRATAGLGLQGVEGGANIRTARAAASLGLQGVEGGANIRTARATAGLNVQGVEENKGAAEFSRQSRSSDFRQEAIENMGFDSNANIRTARATVGAGIQGIEEKQGVAEHYRPARHAEAGIENKGATENKGVGAGLNVGLRVRRDNMAGEMSRHSRAAVGLGVQGVAENFRQTRHAEVGIENKGAAENKGINAGANIGL